MPRFGMDDYVLKAQADTLRANDLLGHLLDEQQDTAVRTFVATHPEDDEGRAKAHQLYHAVDTLRTEINNIIDEMTDQQE